MWGLIIYIKAAFNRQGEKKKRSRYWDENDQDQKHSQTGSLS